MPDFAALSPLPAPRDLPAGTPVLDGPGSVTAEELRSALAATLGAGHDVGRERPALVVGTSGSTGTPKRTVLTAGALEASGRATAAVTGIEGGAHWLLALPVHYVAGAQVIARSVLAGTTATPAPSMAPGRRFTARDFLDTMDRMPAGPRMTSLVPTQVHTLLDAVDRGEVPASELVDGLRSFAAILLGGAPASAHLVARCAELRIPLVLTYGSAETSGGCVYDGAPLPGTRVALDGERILLGGPTLAEGYLEDPARTAASFAVDAEGTRWYRTDDVGRFREDGTLEVLGRADDVIITGGVKVSARAVAQALEEHDAVREAIVVGYPDARWGQAVGAVVSSAHTRPPRPEDLADHVVERLGAPAAPKTILVLERLPLTSTGKPDRSAALRLVHTTATP